MAVGFRPTVANLTNADPPAGLITAALSQLRSACSARYGGAHAVGDALGDAKLGIDVVRAAQSFDLARNWQEQGDA